MRNKFKSGAASFYVVAFSTLILVVIAASFASAIVAEIARSSNDDLSQSAYDAALAGVEDAKIAFNNYWNCIKGGDESMEVPDGDGNVNCKEIVYWVKNYEVEKGGCDMVGHILGRIDETKTGDDIGGVVVSEGSDNGMEQAYTCTIIRTDLTDYRSTLSSANTYRVIKPEFSNGGHASSVVAVKLSWYLREDGAVYNYNNVSGNKVVFSSLNSSAVPTPPVMMLQLVQTAANYNLEQINGKSSNGNTDRAAVYLVPTDNSTMAANGATDDETYTGVYNGSENVVLASSVASTNDHSKDLPYVVYCRDDGEYACSATINLPNPIGGTRIDDTFMIVVSLPYGQPETDFSLEFIDENGNSMELGRTQVKIDSTGRANDLYRRVEARLEPADSTLSYPYYAVQLGGGSDGSALSKELTVTKESSDYSSYSNY